VEKCSDYVKIVRLQTYVLDRAVTAFGKLKKVNQSHFSPGQAQRVYWKLWFPNFMTTAQDCDRLSALRVGRLYPQEILLVIISVRG